MKKVCEICNQEFETIQYGAARKYCFVCVPQTDDAAQRTAWKRNAAKREAVKVSKTKISATLSPMSADERRAIHNALVSFKHVKTVSSGEGKDRRITIVYVD